MLMVSQKQRRTFIMKYIVPDGCVFRSVAGVEFNAGEKLPENYRLKKGDELYSQDYHYTYLGRNKGGWHVNVKDNTKAEYGPLLSEIAEKPLIDMFHTFRWCDKLLKAPEIPDSVIAMRETFCGCYKLTTAPTIPNSVTDMTATFYGCTSLTTAPTIPSSVTNMYSTFDNCLSLKKPPVIPEGVVSMAYTFKDCSSLEEKPELPSTVENADGIFEGTPFDNEQEISESEIDASEPEQDEER